MSDIKDAKFFVFTWDTILAGHYLTEEEAIQAMEVFGCDVVTDCEGTIIQWSKQCRDHKAKIAKRLTDWFRCYLRPEIIAPDHLITYLIEQNRDLFEQNKILQDQLHDAHRDNRRLHDIIQDLGDVPQ